jgi:hypothetical protein
LISGAQSAAEQRVQRTRFSFFVVNSALPAFSVVETRRLGHDFFIV